MVHGGFPGSALITQLFRQFTKPMSQRIVAYAARHPAFQRYGLMKPGRFYYNLEAHLQRLKGPQAIVTDAGADDKNKKKPAVPPIKDEEAVQIGSQLMIEVVIFALLVILLMCDWVRSQYRSAAKEERQRLEFEELESRKAEAKERLELLEREIELLRAELARVPGDS